MEILIPLNHPIGLAELHQRLDILRALGEESRILGILLVPNHAVRLPFAIFASREIEKCNKTYQHQRHRLGTEPDQGNQLRAVRTTAGTN